MKRRSAKVLFTQLNAHVYAATRGRVGGSFGGHRVLLLTTKGRRSGLQRRTPVQFEMIDDLPVIAAAGAGSPRPPQWCGNLRADHSARVQIGGLLWPAEAEEVVGAERDALWRQLVKMNPALEQAQVRAEREIPLFRLRQAPQED